MPSLLKRFLISLQRNEELLLRMFVLVIMLISCEEFPPCG